MSCIHEHILFPLSFVKVLERSTLFKFCLEKKKKDKNNNENNI